MMSPARMLEWWSNDGLHKNFYWVPNNITDDVALNEVDVEEDVQKL